MGVALKRRDNAPIVKDVYGGALDSLMEHRNIKTAEKLVKEMLVKVIKNEYPLDKFILSKQLRDDYAAMKEDYDGPGTIPIHRVLADRMEARDPGNKPQVGDRIAYVYVDGRQGKQGERIDQIDYVRENNLRPDVEFYITNQIQNPVAQLFALCIESMDGYKAPTHSYKQLYKELLEKNSGNTEETTLGVLKQKEKQLDSMIFLKSMALQNVFRKNKRGPMDMFLKR